ncbi:MAG: FHA domain-containing protein [Propionibacteriaceae bacterium]|jgi:hypothetical protein|nr:FHA domain-containing protein [Propionibacteriaceae bacterium]
MADCPNGHQTLASDFCDICGAPVTAGIPAQEAPSRVACPNCGHSNVALALFCEACGYSFVQGAAPAAAPAWETDRPKTAAEEAAELAQTIKEFQAQAATPVPSPAPIASPGPASAVPQPIATDVIPNVEPLPTPDGIPAPAPVSWQPVSTPVPPPQAPEAPVEVQVAPEQSQPAAAPAEAPQPAAFSWEQPEQQAPPPVRVEWVAELWIDPDWYALQGSPDPLPSAGLPDIVPLVKEVNLIGRVSLSKATFPEVDCDLDTGCSRRHAQLTTDWTRWWIEDLGSANGTFVGPANGPLPSMPIPRGKVELLPDQRVYLGAWTRIVVRRATDDEIAAYAG